jgi:hypothetical protein
LESKAKEKYQRHKSRSKKNTGLNWTEEYEKEKTEWNGMFAMLLGGRVLYKPKIACEN